MLDLGGYEAGHWGARAQPTKPYLYNMFPLGLSSMLCFHFLVHTGAHGSNSSYEELRAKGTLTPMANGVTAIVPPEGREA